MSLDRCFATAVTAASMLLASTAAQAGDEFTFPSPSGALIAASNANVTYQPLVANPHGDGVVFGFGYSAKHMSDTPLSLPPAGSPFYSERFGSRTRGADAHGYRFMTHALLYAPYANYSADYYRLFTPGYAVTAWTDRVSGFVELGYGGAVDSWTAAAYYMNRLRGPARRRETAPDLTLMPKFRPHPELEAGPTFTRP